MTDNDSFKPVANLKGIERILFLPVNLSPEWKILLIETAKKTLNPVIQQLKQIYKIPVQFKYVDATRYLYVYIELKPTNCDEDTIIAGINFIINKTGIGIRGDVSMEESGEILKEFFDLKINQPSLSDLLNWLEQFGIQYAQLIEFHPNLIKKQ